MAKNQERHANQHISHAPHKFVSINDIRLARDSVKKSIKYLREIYRHRIGKTPVVSLNNLPEKG
ncbi:MAG: hypothetical protein ACRERX_19375 [Pseudomonas sp.]